MPAMMPPAPRKRSAEARLRGRRSAGRSAGKAVRRERALAPSGLAVRSRDCAVEPSGGAPFG